MYHPYIDVSTPYDSYNSKNIAELSTWAFYEELYSVHLEIKKNQKKKKTHKLFDMTPWYLYQI